MSRAWKVLEYLSDHDYITSLGIINMFGATSPSKVISEVRRLLSVTNLRLADRWERNENTGTRFKIYTIEEA